MVFFGVILDWKTFHLIDCYIIILMETQIQQFDEMWIEYLLLLHQCIIDRAIVKEILMPQLAKQNNGVRAVSWQVPQQSNDYLVAHQENSPSADLNGAAIPLHRNNETATGTCP